MIRHGVLVSERYWSRRDQTSADKSWSIAKSYTSVLVGIAIELGEIESVDQSVADFVPEWQGDERANITIRDLLSMTSGLEWSALDHLHLETGTDPSSPAAAAGDAR